LNNQKKKRLWIVKPGENSNRGTGITIHDDYSKIKQLIQNETSNSANKKTFIIQKYIDRPFLYNRRKFDIRCYMLLVRLNN
jgi:glutathione synthase/RimK-type ligase-like ATP-grasp enzyme